MLQQIQQQYYHQLQLLNNYMVCFFYTIRFDVIPLFFVAISDFIMWATGAYEQKS